MEEAAPPTGVGVTTTLLCPSMDLVLLSPPPPCGGVVFSPSPVVGAAVPLLLLSGAVSQHLSLFRPSFLGRALLGGAPSSSFFAGGDAFSFLLLARAACPSSFGWLSKHNYLVKSLL